MRFERTNSFQKQNSDTPQSANRFESCPLQMKQQEQKTSKELENEAFKRNKFEAFGLQLKEKHATITPVEQKQLGLLQAKMGDFWQQRRDAAPRSGFNLSKISVTSPGENAAPLRGQGAHLNSPQQSLVSPLQAKLTIGEPGDKYEQEADRVASQVVKQINAPASAQSTQGQSVQRQSEKKEELEAKREITPVQWQEEKPEELQAKSTLQNGEGIATGDASKDLESAINSERGGGQPLEAGLQRSMGQAMGADFSGVKVHTDAQSDQLNQSVQAKAFTTGQDVFFRQGAYEPGSRGGQELIAHELTHVVQQKGNQIQRMTSENESTDKGKSGNESTGKVKVKSVDELLGIIRQIKDDKGWDGANYSNTWQCDTISKALCERVEKCEMVQAQGNVLVQPGKIPGGARDGNTKGPKYWHYEYHAYVKFDGVLYDPTFERKISSGDVITAASKPKAARTKNVIKDGKEKIGVFFEYLQFNNICGTFTKDGSLFLYQSLEDLFKAVADPGTEVGDNWKKDEDESESEPDSGEENEPQSE